MVAVVAGVTSERAATVAAAAAAAATTAATAATAVDDRRRVHSLHTMPTRAPSHSERARALVAKRWRRSDIRNGRIRCAHSRRLSTAAHQHSLARSLVCSLACVFLRSRMLVVVVVVVIVDVARRLCVAMQHATHATRRVKTAASGGAFGRAPFGELICFTRASWSTNTMTTTTIKAADHVDVVDDARACLDGRWPHASERTNARCAFVRLFA